MIETTFSTLFTQLLNASEMNVSQLYRELKKNNINISYQALAAYKAFDTVPKFEKAAEILNYFDYNKSDSELTEILNYSRSELKNYKAQERKDIRQGIRLTPSSFAEDITADELDVMIQKRINELSENGDHSFNSYVSSLIKKDLQEQGYLQ